MGWDVGFDPNWKRDIGYGVLGICDHPGCGRGIFRGLDWVCGGDVYGGDRGCGLFFCEDHLDYPDDEDYIGPRLCERCRKKLKPFTPTPDTKRWILWKLKEKSWEKWRNENPEEVKLLRKRLEADQGEGVENGG